MTGNTLNTTQAQAQAQAKAKAQDQAQAQAQVNKGKVSNDSGIFRNTLFAGRKVGSYGVYAVVTLGKGLYNGLAYAGNSRLAAYTGKGIKAAATIVGIGTIAYFSPAAACAGYVLYKVGDKYYSAPADAQPTKENLEEVVDEEIIKQIKDKELEGEDSTPIDLDDDLYEDEEEVIEEMETDKGVEKSESQKGTLDVKEKAEAEAEAEAEAKAEEERIAKEKAEEERIAKEKAEEERIAKEKAEAEAERIAKEKAEEERIAKEKAEEERIAKEKAEAEAERIAKEKAEEERIAKEKAEEERIAKEKAEAEAERIAKEKAEAERIVNEKASYIKEEVIESMETDETVENNESRKGTLVTKKKKQKPATNVLVDLTGDEIKYIPLASPGKRAKLVAKPIARARKKAPYQAKKTKKLESTNQSVQKELAELQKATGNIQERYPLRSSKK